MRKKFKHQKFSSRRLNNFIFMHQLSVITSVSGTRHEIFPLIWQRSTYHDILERQPTDTFQYINVVMIIPLCLPDMKDE